MEENFLNYSLSPIKASAPQLFAHLSADFKPIAVKSRRYSNKDTIFIKNEMKKLEDDDIVEETTTPWRAQVLVSRSENQKTRLVVDYSQTINKFTQLDAYPLPQMDELVNKIAQFSWFSTLDLKSAYHQLELHPSDRIYTGFEACGKLYQFRRVPFGLTNAVPCFQRMVDEIINRGGCKGTYAYLDNITVCGKTKEEHDLNLEKFLSVARESNLTFNDGKCVYSTTSIDLLGYRIEKGSLRPDPERVKPLMDLPVPVDSKSLQRIIGLFAYYAQWIPQYSDKIRPLIQIKKFPIGEEAIDALRVLKKNLSTATLQAVDENLPFTLETDASEFVVAATLSQGGRPVAFHAQTLQSSERNHHSVEKEAFAILVAIRKWSHFLLGRHFTLIKEQRSVAFMYDAKRHSKIKNEKILR